MAYSVLITGGHGAGKTAKALELVEEYPRKIYIATAQALDEDMQQKIDRHKEERDSSYTTIEEHIQLANAIEDASGGGVIIVDCLTVWLNNLLMYNIDVNTAIGQLYHAIENSDTDIVIITNESSLCLIPGNALGKKYMRILADMNKTIAKMANHVCIMVSGLPIWLKGGNLDDKQNS